MIISHKHKFVFSRPLKVGSSSAQAMIVESGILGDNDSYSGYRDAVDSKLTPFVNLPSVTCKDVRDISPYNIPPKLLCEESGPMPLFGHLTPTEMKIMGIIGDKEINEYTFVSIVRDPVDRYLSGWFFDKALKNKDSSIDSLKNDIANGYVPVSFLGRRQRDYFLIEEYVPKNVIFLNTSKLNDGIDAFLKRFGGKINEKRSLKSNYRPKWSKNISKRLLSKGDILSLSEIISDDIKFYNEVYKKCL